MDSDFWEAVSYVEEAKNRRRVLELLVSAGRPMTPTELADEMGVVVKSASRAVRQLADRGLVECTNPDAPRDRRYRPTETGREVRIKIVEIADAVEDAAVVELSEPTLEYVVEQSEEFQEMLSSVQHSRHRKAVLAHIAAVDVPLTPSELAGRMDVGFNTASRAVQELVEQELVRCVNPDADRYRRYELTDQGERVYRALRQ